MTSISSRQRAVGRRVTSTERSMAAKSHTQNRHCTGNQHNYAESKLQLRNQTLQTDNIGFIVFVQASDGVVKGMHESITVPPGCGEKDHFRESTHQQMAFWLPGSRSQLCWCFSQSPLPSQVQEPRQACHLARFTRSRPLAMPPPEAPTFVYNGRTFSFRFWLSEVGPVSPLKVGRCDDRFFCFGWFGTWGGCHVLLGDPFPVPSCTLQPCSRDFPTMGC